MLSLLNDQGIQRKSSPLILQTQQTNIPHLWWKCASHGYTIHQNTNSLNRVYLPDMFSAFLALIQPRLSWTVFCLQWSKLFSVRLVWINGSGKKDIFHWKKMREIFRKDFSTIILNLCLCILLVSQEQIQILNTTFTEVEFSIQKSRTSLI